MEHRSGGTPRSRSMPSRLSIALVVLVAATASAARLATRSHTPFQWDPVNFALAMDRIDVSQHQPHPPPAIGYVVAGRLLRPVVGDANLALVVWNLLMTAVATVLVFLFAARGASRHPERHGWLAVAFLLGSPLVWFYGCVAEIYATEMTLMLLVAYASFCVLNGDRGGGELLALTLAALGAFRVSGLAFALPLALYSCWRARLPRARRATILFLGATAAWLVPLLIVVGPGPYWGTFWDQFRQTSQATSVLAGASLRELNRHLRDFLLAVASGVGPPGLVVWPVFLIARKVRLLPSPGLVRLAGLWLFPATIFYVLIHMAKPGYVLACVPLLSLAAAFHYAQERSRAIRWVLAAAHTAAGGVFFLAAQPWTGAAIGEGLR